MIESIKKEKIFYFLSVLILVISLRTLFIPLQGDENTYFEIGSNILQGKYYQGDNPSSVSPIIPFIMAFFYNSKLPMLGFGLHKLFHIVLTFLGFRFAFLTFNKLELDKTIIYYLLALTSLSTGFITFLSSLYPEAIVFVCFWGTIYYFNLPKNISNFKKFFLLLVLLIFSRYVYAVIGILVLLYYYFIYINSRTSFWKLFVISLILIAPMFLWFKYIHNIETQNLSEISYFDRYKSSENPLLYNLKCGLGLAQNHEVGRINGIPAFISLFLPITGIRNYFLSILLLIIIVFGLYKNKKNKIVFSLFVSFILVFLGFTFAGTGFSRYWLVLLPIIYLGFYYSYTYFFKNPKYFILFSKVACLILLLNEVRITILLLNKNLL